MGQKTLDSIMDELETGLNEDIGKTSLRHLFDRLDKKQIKLKSELTDREIKKIVKILFLAETLDMNRLNGMIDVFLQLRVSKDRKGRQEIIEALKTITDNTTGRSGLTGLGSFFQGRVA